MLGHHRPASETPFKWRFACGPMMAYFIGIWILSPSLSEKKMKIKRCQSSIPLLQNFLDPHMSWDLAISDNRGS